MIKKKRDHKDQTKGNHIAWIIMATIKVSQKVMHKAKAITELED